MAAPWGVRTPGRFLIRSVPRTGAEEEGSVRMKIVLRADVPKLGDAGSVQTVANGYARNYLIPRGLAVVATTGELKVAANNDAARERKITKQEQQMQSLADKIDGQRLEFTARSGEKGRLYGSITAGDITERLIATIGEDIDRRKVVLDDPIRSVGEHTVTVHLVGRLRPQVRVIVLAEKDDTDDTVESEPIEDTEPVDSAEAARDDDDAHSSASEEEASGAAGHPEPGSGHDDSKTETVDDGPAHRPIDGVPGAYGNVETRGGAATDSETHGAGAQVDEEPTASA